MPWKAGGSHSQQPAHGLHTKTSARGWVFATGGGDPKGHPSSCRATGWHWGSLGEGTSLLLWPGPALAGRIPLASPESNCTAQAMLRTDLSSQERKHQAGMQSVLSLPTRLPDTLLSPFKASPHQHKAITLVSLYWWKNEISFTPAFYAAPAPLLLLTRPWKLVNPPNPVFKLFLTASLPVHPPPWGCVGITVATPVVGNVTGVAVPWVPQQPLGARRGCGMSRMEPEPRNTALSALGGRGHLGAERVGCGRMRQCRDSHCHLRERQRNASPESGKPWHSRLGLETKQLLRGQGRV